MFAYNVPIIHLNINIVVKVGEGLFIFLNRDDIPLSVLDSMAAKVECNNELWEKLGLLRNATRLNWG